MTNNDPLDSYDNKFNHPFPDWKGNYGNRLQACVTLLRINGFLTDAERDRVHARIEKAWIKEANK